MGATGGHRSQSRLDARPKKLASVPRTFVDAVLDRREQADLAIDHERSGELVAIAAPDRWLRPGSYAVSIFPVGGDELVFQVQPFVTKPGVSQIVYAVGSLVNETFTLLVQSFDLGFTPPRRAVR